MRCCWGKFDFVIWEFLTGGPPAHPTSKAITENKRIFFVYVSLVIKSEEPNEPVEKVTFSKSASSP
jgi:hypothetical protein